MTASGQFDTPVGDNRGSNLVAVRQYNERLILQLIRRASSLPKAEIARLTQLSPQTVSVIINRLLKEGLLLKHSPQRRQGQVGQPSVPISLNPKGAYSIGVKIGRRSLDVILIDFQGQVLKASHHTYTYPDPEWIFKQIEQDIAAIRQQASPLQQQKLVGIGVVSPTWLGGWQQEMNAPVEILQRWNDINIQQQLAAQQNLHVWYSNDATGACIAELVFGHGARFAAYLYIFIGTFIGGGVVLNNTLYAGLHGNAGALGPMPVVTQDSHKPVQLLTCASRYLLENKWLAQGLDPEQGFQQLIQGTLNQDACAQYQTWLETATEAIAFAICSATSVIDFENVIIDGIFPPEIGQQIIQYTEQALDRFDLEGLQRPQLLAGALGNDARALGGAILPLYAEFAPDREVLLKLVAREV